MHKSDFFIFGCGLFLLFVWFAVSLGFVFEHNQYSNYFESKPRFSGWIVSDPEKSGPGQQSFEVLPKGFRQKILITTFSKNEFFYGEELFIYGKIKKPISSAGFDYAHYLAAKNIYARMYNPQTYVIGRARRNVILFYALKFKHALFRRVKKNLPGEQGNLLLALMIGEKGLLAGSTVAAFSATGTAHLIAVASYILSLLLILTVKLQKFIGRLAATFCAVAGTVIYLVIADFSSGVWRAALMFWILYIGKLTGRQYAVLNALAFTAVLLVYFNPLIIKYDLGFMYSFAAVAGIIYFAPLFKLLFARIPDFFSARQILAVTLAAQIATLPLTLYYFQQLPVFAPISNLLIIPAVTPAIFGGYFLLLPGLGAVFARILLAPLNYILAVVYFFAGLPLASFYIHFNTTALVAAYVLELFLLVYFYSWRRISVYGFDEL